MNQANEGEETISRQKIEQIADNLKSSAESVIGLLSTDEIRVKELLEATRFMARSARRIARRANWKVGEAPLGNELQSSPRPRPEGGRAPRPRDDRPRRGRGGPPRRGPPRDRGRGNDRRGGGGGYRND